MRVVVVAAAVMLVAAACDRGPKTVKIQIPNTPNPAKAGRLELTKYADKIVVTNHTDQRAWDCVVIVDEAIRGELGELVPAQTVTVMRTRFRPYTEANDFYARAKKETVMECTTAAGRVLATFDVAGEYTVPAEALKPPR